MRIKNIIRSLVVVIMMFSMILVISLYKEYSYTDTCSGAMGFPETAYMYYYEKYGEFPKGNKDIVDMLFGTKYTKEWKIISLNDIKRFTLKNLIAIYDSTGHDINYWYKQNIDIFSKRKDIYIYYPIYNRANKKRESFILLSTGIDGIGNNLNIADTLYYDNWHKKVNVYNKIPLMYYSNKNNIISYTEGLGTYRYTLFDKLFGKRDLLLMMAKKDNDYSVKLLDSI